MPALQEYKCPCCGAPILFDSSIQKMKCLYCDTEFEMDVLKQFDEQLKQTQKNDMQWDISASQWVEGEETGLRVYSCNSCGGQVVGDVTTAASTCPYCGSPVVMLSQLSGDLRPDYVIPFKLDKEAAKAALMKHYGGKKLLPKVFKDQNHIDEVKGVYVPFWIFDSDAQADIRYKATTIRKWRQGYYDCTETAFYSLLRGGSLSFAHVPVDGSSKMPDDLMESIEPFDFTQAVDFQTAYLSGYLADRYDVDDQQSIGRANARIKATTEDLFAQSVRRYATVTPESSSIRLDKAVAKYALLPVWLLNTTWEGTQYTFVMNGQTGKLAGDLPIDKKALNKWRWGLTFAIGGGIYALLWLFRLISLI